MKYTPSFSIVVLNYNGKEIIKECLSSLIKTEYPKDKIEIVVIDNNSNDGSFKILKKFKKIKLIRNKKNIGYAKGNNLCKRFVKNEYLIFLNNDISVSKTWLKEIVNNFSSEVGSYGPKVLSYYDSSKIDSFGGSFLKPFCIGFKDRFYNAPDKKLKNCLVPFVGGCALVIKKELFFRLGGFDEDYFMYFEDCDLGLRLLKAGYKNLIISESKVYHRHSYTVKREFKNNYKNYLISRNSLITFLKVYSLKEIILYSPLVFGLRISYITYNLLRLKISLAHAHYKGIVWIIKNFKKIIRKREECQKLILSVKLSH